MSCLAEVDTMWCKKITQILNYCLIAGTSSNHPGRHSMFLLGELLLSQEVYGKISELYDAIAILLLFCKWVPKSEAILCGVYWWWTSHSKSFPVPFIISLFCIYSVSQLHILNLQSQLTLRGLPSKPWPRNFLKTKLWKILGGFLICFPPLRDHWCLVSWKLLFHFCCVFCYYCFRWELKYSLLVQLVLRFF